MASLGADFAAALPLDPMRPDHGFAEIRQISWQASCNDTPDSKKGSVMFDQKLKTRSNALDQNIREMAVEVVFFDDEERPVKREKRALSALLSPLRGPIFRT